MFSDKTSSMSSSSADIITDKKNLIKTVTDMMKTEQYQKLRKVVISLYEDPNLYPIGSCSTSPYPTPHARYDYAVDRRTIALMATNDDERDKWCEGLRLLEEEKRTEYNKSPLTFKAYIPTPMDLFIKNVEPSSKSTTDETIHYPFDTHYVQIMKNLEPLSKCLKHTKTLYNQFGFMSTLQMVYRDETDQKLHPTTRMRDALILCFGNDKEVMNAYDFFLTERKSSYIGNIVVNIEFALFEYFLSQETYSYHLRRDCGFVELSKSKIIDKTSAPFNFCLKQVMEELEPLSKFLNSYNRIFPCHSASVLRSAYYNPIDYNADQKLKPELRVRNVLKSLGGTKEVIDAYDHFLVYRKGHYHKDITTSNIEFALLEYFLSWEMSEFYLSNTNK